jgi:hypothetical protein
MTRILVAFEESYRVYQDAIAGTIQALRPHVEVSVCELDALEAEVARLDPDLVICTRPKDTVDADAKPAWLELPTEKHKRLAKLCLDGVYSEVENPGLAELLRVVDETERLLGTRGELKRC